MIWVPKHNPCMLYQAIRISQQANQPDIRVQQWWLYENTHCFNGGPGIPGKIYQIPAAPKGTWLCCHPSSSRGWVQVDSAVASKPPTDLLGWLVFCGGGGEVGCKKKTKFLERLDIWMDGCFVFFRNWEIELMKWRFFLKSSWTQTQGLIHSAWFFVYCMILSLKWWPICTRCKG